MSEEGTIRKNETRNNFVPAKLLNIQSEGGDTVDQQEESREDIG